MIDVPETKTEEALVEEELTREVEHRLRRTAGDERVKRREERQGKK